MASPTELEVRAALDEMGLVREVEIHSGRNGVSVRVTIGLTQPFCLMGIPFLKSARERLSAMPGVSDVDVSLASGIDWTPARFAPAYAERLKRVRQARGVTSDPMPPPSNSA